MVATATMVEGSLDVLSCATLMQLAALDLPASVNGAIVVFSLLELANACQSFALQVLLSGGHDDTPLDLVKWKGKHCLLYCRKRIQERERGGKGREGRRERIESNRSNGDGITTVQISKISL
jgi:hypothetical protein